ncbi:GNAT family N-acetyltransferase [Paenibacillus glacialis]|uniref:GCN5 family acetyltransferase n=1 Tax=Paenibacillus glacialis TaxID=494026 RepID=A0A168HP61_9BACL|nr:GNAT family N-acetyltransferase [Paenibacillus glacialis]OAB38386.1 GCN5 family acetyltransferase [Paenibacillus glacialis]
MEVLYKDFLISDDKDKINRQFVLDYLAQSYWANRRSPERILKSIDSSHCYGVYYNDNQIGFARIFTDGATMFYLCDVFVVQEYQGQGVGKKLVEIITSSQEYEWMTGILGTLDAHGLYEQYGFERNSERFMSRPPQGRKI